MADGDNQSGQPPLWMMVMWSIFLVVTLAAAGLMLKMC